MKTTSNKVTIKRVTKGTKGKPHQLKVELTEKVTPRNKTSLVEKVISNREVKYIYPEGIEDTLSRKSHRQAVRNELKRLELSMLKIKDQDSKEFHKAKKAYEQFVKKNYKVS